MENGDGSEAMERHADLETVGAAAVSDLERIRCRILELQEKQEREILELGGPLAYIQEKAPTLSQLSNGPRWTLRLVSSANELGWEAADRRVEECLRCPPTGGTCANSSQAGLVPVFGEEKLDFDRCERWAVHLKRERMIVSGVPREMVDVKLDHVIARESYPLRDGLGVWASKAIRKERPAPLLLTGDRNWIRTELMVGLTRHICRPSVRLHYTFGPKLAMQLKEYFRLRDEHVDGDDPRYEFEKCDVLVIDNLDPKPEGREEWKSWFLEELDYLLWQRISNGKTTLMSSRMAMPELVKYFALAFSFPIAQIDISHPDFGPLKK